MKKVTDFVFKNGKYILTLCAIILLIKVAHQGSQISDKDGAIKVLLDSAKTYRNDLGQAVAEAKIATITSIKQLKQIATKDDMINRLQTRVTAYEKSGGKTGTVIAVDGYTENKGTTKTQIIIDTSVVKATSVVEIVYPIYATTWSEKWSSGRIIATKDSITRDIKTVDKLDIIVGWKRANIFKPWIAEVQAVNLNPNSVTTDIKSVTVAPRVSPWAFGVGVTYNVNPFGGQVTTPSLNNVGVSVGVYRTIFRLPIKQN